MTTCGGRRVAPPAGRRRRVALMHGLLWLFVVVSAACHGASVSGAPPIFEHRLTTALVPSDEGILGRVVQTDKVILLTTYHRLVLVGRTGITSRIVPLKGIEQNEDLTGFAGLADGSLWTLSGWSTLLRIDSEGHVVERLELGRPFTGLHSGFRSLVYQPLDFTPGSPALMAGPPGKPDHLAWGALRVRTGSDPGPVRLGLSLAKCGAIVNGRLPCWLAGAPAIELIDEQGRGSLLALPALEPFVITDTSAFANNPHRLIRDAWLDDEGIWVLARAGADEEPDRRGQRGLWRFNRAGEVTFKHRLASAARVILGVDVAGVRLLMSSGDIVAVVR